MENTSFYFNGDPQLERMYFFFTCTPVVQWTTVWLILVLENFFKIFLKRVRKYTLNCYLFISSRVPMHYNTSQFMCSFFKIIILLLSCVFSPCYSCNHYSFLYWLSSIHLHWFKGKIYWAYNENIFDICFRLMML